MIKALVVSLSIPMLAGCSAAWRDENRAQERWWNKAESGAGPRRRVDPFACPPKPLPGCEPANRGARESRCEQGDAMACMDVGVPLLLWGLGDVATADARRFLERACVIGWEKADERALQACTLLGVAHLTGLGGFPDDPKLGVALLGERCRMTDGLACAYLAYARERGLGTEQDLQGALKAYDELCSVRYDGYLDGPEFPSKALARVQWQPFACLRLAFLADAHVIDVAPEFAAQLFASVCFGAERLLGSTTTAEPDPSALGRIACPIAAQRFIEHGYTYRAFRSLNDYRRLPEGSFEHDVMGLLEVGCSDGSAEACNMLRKAFEDAEGRGEIFDLR